MESKQVVLSLVMVAAIEQALAADALPRYLLCTLSERAAEAPRYIASSRVNDAF
jgi:hypothetical protein